MDSGRFSQHIFFIPHVPQKYNHIIVMDQQDIGWINHIGQVFNEGIGNR